MASLTKKRTIPVWFTADPAATKGKAAKGICYVTLNRNDTKESVFSKVFEKIKLDGHVTYRCECNFSLLTEDEKAIEEHVRQFAIIEQKGDEKGER